MPKPANCKQVRETSASQCAAAVRNIFPQVYKNTKQQCTFMSFSPSPRYLLVTLLEEMLKKQNADSDATAFASIVLPVPAKRERSEGSITNTLSASHYKY